MRNNRDQRLKREQRREFQIYRERKKEKEKRGMREREWGGWMSGTERAGESGCCRT